MRHHESLEQPDAGTDRSGASRGELLQATCRRTGAAKRTALVSPSPSRSPGFPSLTNSKPERSPRQPPRRLGRGARFTRTGARACVIKGSKAEPKEAQSPYLVGQTFLSASPEPVGRRRGSASWSGVASPALRRQECLPTAGRSALPDWSEGVAAKKPVYPACPERSLRERKRGTGLLRRFVFTHEGWSITGQRWQRLPGSHKQSLSPSRCAG